jgi:two-component system, OmpR family, sensor histidine kinase VicK
MSNNPTSAPSREERERERERERSMLEAVVRQIPVGLIAVDAGGVPVAVNDEAKRLLGGPDRLSIMGGWQAHAEPGDEDAASTPISRALISGETISAERFELNRADTTIVVEVNASPVRGRDGDIVGAVAVFQDLTSREMYDRAQRDFVSNAAHELQSPLAAIVSAVEVLQRGAKDTSDRDLFLGHIDREAQRLTHLVRSLLTLARVQTGAEVPRKEVVALEPLLREICSELQPAAGVEVNVSCPPDLALISNADLVRHAIDNLARNAVKFTHQGSISIEARAGGGHLEVIVEDTGEGIDPADRELVLQRFVSRNGADGFGLGLSLVSAIMEALGGEIHLDSTVGKGTLALLHFPSAASLVKP